MWQIYSLCANLLYPSPQSPQKLSFQSPPAAPACRTELGRSGKNWTSWGWKAAASRNVPEQDPHHCGRKWDKGWVRGEQLIPAWHMERGMMWEARHGGMCHHYYYYIRGSCNQRHREIVIDIDHWGGMRNKTQHHLANTYLWAAVLASTTPAVCIHDRTGFIPPPSGSSFMVVPPLGIFSWIPNIKTKFLGNNQLLSNEGSKW